MMYIAKLICEGRFASESVLREGYQKLRCTKLKIANKNDFILDFRIKGR